MSSLCFAWDAACISGRWARSYYLASWGLLVGPKYQKLMALGAAQLEVVRLPSLLRIGVFGGPSGSAACGFG